MFSFLHEFAHRAAGKYLGYSPEKISMGLFGGVLHIREGFVRPLDELLIHLAGPFFNIIMAALFYCAFLFYPLAIMETLVLSNLVLGLFNLMPFYPLDGGKIVGLYLAIFLGYGRSEKISRVFSLLFSLFFFLLGIYLVQYSMLNLLISVLAVNLYIAAKQDNSFIFYRVSREIQQNKTNRSRIVVVREGVSAMRILERYKPFENRWITVVNERGCYRGQLSEEELLDGVYHCGIYADFHKLLKHKKKKKRNGENR